MSLTPPPQIPSGNDGAGAPPPPPSVGITDPPITSLSPQLAINHQQEPFSSPPTASANSIDSTSAPQPRPPKQLERRSLELLSDVSSIAAPTSVPHPPAICVPPMIRPSQNDSDPQVQVQVQVNAQPSSQAPTQVVAVRAQDAPTPPTLSAQAQAEAATREVVPTPPKGKSRKHILLSRHSPLAASPHSPALPSAKRYITIAPTPTATTASPQDTNHTLLHNNHQNNQFYHHSRLLPVVTPTAGDGTSVTQNVVSNPTAHTGASESEPQAPNPPPLWIGQHSSGTTEEALPPQQPILLPAIEEEVEETKAKPNKRLRTSSEEKDRDRSKEAENMKIDPEAVAEAVARAAEQQRAELERAAMMAEVARAAQAEAQAQAQAQAHAQGQGQGSSQAQGQVQSSLPSPLLAPALAVVPDATAASAATASTVELHSVNNHDADAVPISNLPPSSVGAPDPAAAAAVTAFSSPSPSPSSRERLGAAIARAGGGPLPYIGSPHTSGTAAPPMPSSFKLTPKIVDSSSFPAGPPPPAAGAADVIGVGAPINSGVPPPPPQFPSPRPSSSSSAATPRPNVRLNKFVRRLHDMLLSERDSGIVEWRRGLLVLHSTDAFARTILPKYFNTKNFKTFRRQLNYYGFVHVRSFSATGSTTTALWVNRDLARRGTSSVGSVLMLKRVEPSEAGRTAEGRRSRKEEAVSTVEEDIGISTRALQLEQIRSLALRKPSNENDERGGDAAPHGGHPASPIAAASPAASVSSPPTLPPVMMSYRHVAPPPAAASSSPSSSPLHPPPGCAPPALVVPPPTSASAPTMSTAMASAVPAPEHNASTPSEIVLPNPWASVSDQCLPFVAASPAVVPPPLPPSSSSTASTQVPTGDEGMMMGGQESSAASAAIQQDDGSNAANLLLLLSRSSCSTSSLSSSSSSSAAGAMMVPEVATSTY